MKPSTVIRAMCDGLEEQSQRDDFKIGMWTFGETDKGICYGCAATCAIQKLYNVNFTSDNIRGVFKRASVLNIVANDLRALEVAVEWLRIYNLSEFFGYFDIVDYPEPKQEWHLWSHNWQWYLPAIREYATLLEERGL